VLCCVVLCCVVLCCDVMCCVVMCCDVMCDDFCFRLLCIVSSALPSLARLCLVSSLPGLLKSFRESCASDTPLLGYSNVALLALKAQVLLGPHSIP
jgi:hypothetical protein